MDDLFHQYQEELLRAQYRVSEAIMSKLPRGTVREDFLRESIFKRRTKLIGGKGTVVCNGRQSEECDIIFYDQSLAVNILGGQLCIAPRQCSLVLEVKSNATSKDFEKTNENFGLIKSLEKGCQPLCGLFCYNTAISKETILERFGFAYDDDTESWRMYSYPQKYPNIDFAICLAASTEEDWEDEQFFVIKDKPSGEYVLILDPPVLKHLFAITDNL